MRASRAARVPSSVAGAITVVRKYRVPSTSVGAVGGVHRHAAVADAVEQPQPPAQFIRRSAPQHRTGTSLDAVHIGRELING